MDNQVVLASTCAASLKLVLICTGVGWLLRTCRIPNDTAPVLSKVSSVSFRDKVRVRVRIRVRDREG